MNAFLACGWSSTASKVSVTKVDFLILSLLAPCKIFSEKLQILRMQQGVDWCRSRRCRGCRQKCPWGQGSSRKPLPRPLGRHDLKLVRSRCARRPLHPGHGRVQPPGHIRASRSPILRLEHARGAAGRSRCREVGRAQLWGRVNIGTEQRRNQSPVSGRNE